jgi:hypothetical protein
MGGMAGQAALSAGDRGMGDGRLFSLVGMAAEAQLVACIGEEFRVLRIMGVVAGKAHAALERRVFDRAAGLEPGLIVALITEFSSAERRTKGLVGCRRIMAHITRLRDNRVMCTALEKLGLHGRMGIVARCTGLGANRIPAMRFLEGFLLAVVTPQAESGACGLQQVRLVGAMGNVAYAASAGLKGLVHHFLFELFPRVALNAEFGSFRFEQVFRL